MTWESEIKFYRSIVFKATAATAICFLAVASVFPDAGVKAFAASVLSFGAVFLLIVRPLHKLIRKVKEIGKGNFKTFLDVKGKDELGLLGYEINGIISAVRERNMKINEYFNERMTLSNISGMLKKLGMDEDAMYPVLRALNDGLNVEQCALLFFRDDNSVELKNFIGMTKQKADVVRSYIESVLRICYSLSSPDEHNGAIDGIKREWTKLFYDTVYFDGFIAATIRQGGRAIGALTVHKIKNRDLADPEIQKFFSVLTAMIAPYFYMKTPKGDA